MVLGCISSFPCTIRKAARGYHQIEEIPNNLKNERFPAHTPIRTGWEELHYSRKHSKRYLSPAEACALLLRSHAPGAEGGEMLPAPRMALPACFLLFFHFTVNSLLMNQAKNNRRSLILLVHTTNVPVRPWQGQPPASYRWAGKEGDLCEKPVHLEERRKLNCCQRNNLLNFLMNISATQSIFVDLN